MLRPVCRKTNEYVAYARNTESGCKMEMKNINRCSGGLRMEDQGERSPHTFLVNNFSIPRPRRKQGDRCVFKRVFNVTDSGFKAAAWT